MKFVAAALFSLALGVSAYTTPTTFDVSTNPVYSPNSGMKVQSGKPYTVTWGVSVFPYLYMTKHRETQLIHRRPTLPAL